MIRILKSDKMNLDAPHAPKLYPPFFLYNAALGLSVYMSLVFGYLTAMEPVHYSTSPTLQYPYHICPLRLMLLSEI